MKKQIEHKDPCYLTSRINQICSKESRILELGCGDGRNLKRLKEFGFIFVLMRQGEVLLLVFIQNLK